MNGEVRVCKNSDEVAEQTARHLVAIIGERPGERRSLALSGGSSPQRLYRLLASTPWREQIDWENLHLFLVDERFLPLDHPDSNFRMIRETLLEPRAVKAGGGSGNLLPLANVHPMPTGGTAEECADRYEAELREFFRDSLPRFDCIMLGMGPDGHTASLFPGHVHPGHRWVLAIHNSPKPPPTRLSLSLELINQARQVIFLVTGHDRAKVLAMLRETGQPSLPAGLVKPVDGRLTWMVDEAAWGE